MMIVINQTDIMRTKSKRTNRFGERLRQLRLARGLTQTELGGLCGLTQRMIGHYETVAKYPPANLVPDLAKALKVSTDELLGAVPFKDEELSKNKNLMRRFLKVNLLPLRDQRTVFSLINALKGKQSSKKSSNGSH